MRDPAWGATKTKPELRRRTEVEKQGEEVGSPRNTEILPVVIIAIGLGSVPDG